MYQYQLTHSTGFVLVSLATNDPNSFVPIEFEGESGAVAEIREWLYYQTGAFGHLIGEKTSPMDLQSAMARATKYSHKRVQGEAAEYLSWLPPGAVS